MSTNISFFFEFYIDWVVAVGGSVFLAKNDGVNMLGIFGGASYTGALNMYGLINSDDTSCGNP